MQLTQCDITGGNLSDHLQPQKTLYFFFTYALTVVTVAWKSLLQTSVTVNLHSKKLEKESRYYVLFQTLCKLVLKIWENLDETFSEHSVRHWCYRSVQRAVSPPSLFTVNDELKCSERRAAVEHEPLKRS